MNGVIRVSSSDPIADMLTRLRNAATARHDTVIVPASKMKLSIAAILKEAGFIKDFELIKGKPAQTIKVYLKYGPHNEPAIANIERVSKPGLRINVERSEIPRVYGGLGIAILSTSQGVMTGQKAWRQGVGGELLCYVW
jgi:small subunit ribosomal protein S8